MTLSLKCTCGVRLDIPEDFAGKQLTCPDCQHPIAVPRSDPALIKTSGLALASLLLALVGAFTVIGTLLAVVFGVLALAHLRRHPETITGKPYALAGIGLGIVFTMVTVTAYSFVEQLGLRNLMGQAQWAGKLDYDIPKTIIRNNEFFSIERPSDRWGLKKPTSKNGPGNAEEDPSGIDEMLLVNVEEDAHIFVLTERMQGDLDSYLTNAKEKLEKEDIGKIFGSKASGRVEVRSTKRPPAVGGLNFVEMVADKKVGGQERTFIVRVAQKQNDNFVYQIFACARKSNFERVEPQLRKALASFKVLDNER